MLEVPSTMREPPAGCGRVCNHVVSVLVPTSLAETRLKGVKIKIALDKVLVFGLVLELHIIVKNWDYGYVSNVFLKGGGGMGGSKV